MLASMYSKTQQSRPHSPAPLLQVVKAWHEEVGEGGAGMGEERGEVSEWDDGTDNPNNAERNVPTQPSEEESPPPPPQLRCPASNEQPGRLRLPAKPVPRSRAVAVHRAPCRAAEPTQSSPHPHPQSCPSPGSESVLVLRTDPSLFLTCPSCNPPRTSCTYI